MPWEERKKMEYVILLKPNSNIPFFEEMKRMCIYEAKIVFAKLNIKTEIFEVVQMGKAYFLMFKTDKKLDEKAMKHIANLSFYYTIFEIESDNLLRPIDIAATNYLGDDISVRLKYTGKTNETFTRLLLNIAIYSTDFYDLDSINVLDPLCGKGTTLFESLILGCNAYGIEKNKKYVDELYNYLLRYLREGKYKHNSQKGKVSADKNNIGEMIEVNIGKTKGELKEKSGKKLKVLRGDTTDAHKFFKKNSMHIIVGDLPYGIQHMGKSKGETFRKLDEFLDASFKSWSILLKKGGVVALSWNTYTNKRDEIAKILEENGFTVFCDDNYLNFFHRVSQAINRDIIVAKKI